MANINQSFNEERLNTYYNKIQQRLSPTTVNACQQIAWSLKPQLNRLLSTSIWERQLIQEIQSQITYKNLSSMADGDIEAMLFIVLMEAAKSAQEDLKDVMRTVKNINNEKKMQREKLKKLMRELIDESEGKFQRHPPLIVR